MSGDSDNEFDNGGETPAPPPAEPKAEEPARVPRRAFRAWESAQREESALSKLGKRISGIFAKRPSQQTTPVEEPAQSSELELIMPEPLPTDATAVEATHETTDVTPHETAVEEPEAAIDPAFYVPPELESELKPKAELQPEFASEPETQKPGFFSRLFGRKSKPEPVVDSFEVEKDESADLVPAAPEEEPLLSTAEHEEPLLSTAEHADPQLQETLEPMLLDSAPELPVADAELPGFDEPPVAPIEAAEPLLEEPTTEPIPESRGLFGRLFSRKPKVSRPIPVEKPDVIEPTLEEMPALEPQAEPEAEPQPEVVSFESFDDSVPPDSGSAFSSVEDALPAEPEPSTVDLIEAALAEPIVEEEKKPGFFGRLFSRKSKSQLRPSLEIEFHEDRVEAAAHALDDVSGESFAGSAGEVADPYASVEEALPSPVEDVSTLEVPAITPEDLRFAPPAAPPVEEPVAADSRSTIEVEPYDPFAQTLDPNMQPQAVPDEPMSAEELELEAELGLRPGAGEADRKTDEFEIPSVDTEATTGEIIEPEGVQEAKLTWWMRLLGRTPKVATAAAAALGGTVVEGKPDFLFSKFKAFYGEIIRFKHQKTEFAAGFSTQMLTDFSADLSPDAAASAQSQALHQMLELQAAEAQWMGGEAKERYPDAQYAMACMADELFMHMEWDGQAAWRNHLLEVKLFKSHAADVELFRRIDKLLKEQPNSHVARDLARVYLLVLAAGFQGKYRPFGLPRALAQYRQRLYEYIHQGDSLMLYAPDRRIFPEAASRTLEGHAVGRFSSLQRWAAILVFLVLGYTVLAHYAWNRVSADLKDVTERIRAASSTSGASTSPTSSAATAASGGGR